VLRFNGDCGLLRVVLPHRAPRCCCLSEKEAGQGRRA
jgi:hypothetical protein